MTTLEAAIEASMTTIPCSELADLCRAGNEKTGSTRPGEASGMLSGQGVIVGWQILLRQCNKILNEITAKDRHVSSLYVLGRMMKDFPDVFRGAYGVRFAKCCFRLGFFFWQNIHELLLFVLFVSSNMMMSEACADMAVNSSILQSIAVHCVFEIAGESATPRAPRHISRCPSLRLPNSVRRPGSGGLQAWQ